MGTAAIRVNYVHIQQIYHRLHLDRKVWLFFLVGLLVRIMLLPLAAHSDLFHTYWYASQILTHSGFSIGFQNLLEYGHAAYLWIISGLLPPSNLLWASQPQNPFQTTDAQAAQVWFGFINNPYIFRILFLLKFPYLLFDLACAIVLLLLGTDHKKSTRLFGLWWLNPVLIFATYVYGRHEVIAIFFILISFYLFRKGNWWQSLVWLGVAIAIRYYSLLLLPFFVFSMPISTSRRVKGILLGLLPWLSVNVFTLLLRGTSEVVSLANIQHDNYLLASKLPLGAWDNLYIFPIIYIVLFLHRFINPNLTWKSFQYYGLILMLLLFIFSYTAQSPQYWTWFLPWIVIAVSDDPSLLPFHILQVICLFGYGLIGGRATAGYLFGSIAPEFFWSLPSPLELLSKFAAPETIISFSHSVFAGISLWIIYLTYQKLTQNKEAFINQSLAS